MNNPPSSDTVSRRTALRSLAAFGALGTLAGTKETPPAEPPAITLKKGSVIVFQDDSITDAGRKKEVRLPNDSKALGNGYAAMVAGALLGDYPDLGLKFHNRGISGNKIPDLEARWQEDAIDLKPDVLGILIGINDLWHTVAFGSKYKGTIDDYESGFRKLIERTCGGDPIPRISPPAGQAAVPASCGPNPGSRCPARKSRPRHSDRGSRSPGRESHRHRRS